MITLIDIQEVTKQFGEAILTDTRRVHAIISDWKPHETIHINDVSRLCRQWQQGMRPSKRMEFPVSTFRAKQPVSVLNNKHDTKDTAGTISIKPTIKVGINTNTISIYTDTSKSFYSKK